MNDMFSSAGWQSMGVKRAMGRSRTQVYRVEHSRTVGLLAAPLHLSTPKFWRVVSDKPRSVEASIVILEDREFCPRLWRYGIATGCRISISLCIEIASNDDKPRFSSDGDAAPHHQNASTRRCYSIDAAISIAFSASSPHFDSMIQNLDSSLNVTFLHMFEFQMHLLPTAVQTGLTVKGSHGRPPGSPMRLEIGCMQSVPDCLGRELSAISSCKP
ncbi:G protein-coupled receptor, class C, group 5, member Bb [Lates japonicus]|uniref:G protein-coupled receptor, class C, group 5, member Bb n=1 Tax=Lates japonicus TaxID=270547 RepID=A0AAD3RC35_LATJO|nr:G protein-coupled receptor, class C, group 5, member Bb [Lates japonicus]